MFNFEQETNLVVTKEDKQHLWEQVCELIEMYIDTNIMMMKSPYFHDDINNFIMNEMRNMYENIYDDIFEEELYVILQKGNRFYFSKEIPRRSYQISFAKPRVNIPKLSSIIKQLRDTPQHEQRTAGWFNDRWNMISASSAWKALSSESYKNSLIYEKCVPIDAKKFGSVNINSPLHWGQKYEPLSIQIYEQKYNTSVEDFGCIPHPKYSNIGASPDGINTDKKSTRYGRMVEVKNRFSESVPITGNPKEEYWIQMQMQMNVCNLNECDFLETRFKEYSCATEFYNDGASFTETEDGKKKGIYLCFEKDGFPHYEFPELNLSFDEFDKWEQEKISQLTQKNYQWVSYIYWYLDKMSCVLVFRNKKWFEKASQELNALWNVILKERVSGYQHRAPNKRERKPKDVGSSCLIDISSLKIS